MISCDGMVMAWSYGDDKLWRWSYGDDKLWWHGHTEMISCGGMVIRR